MSSLEEDMAALKAEIAKYGRLFDAATATEERIVLGNMITAKQNRLTELIKLSAPAKQAGRYGRPPTISNSCNIQDEKEIIMFQNFSNPELEDATELRPEIHCVTADDFKSWTCRGFFMYSVGADDDDVSVSKFDKIVAGNVYFLKRPGYSFYGFAEAEATVQTHDAMKCIREGSIEDDELKRFADLKPEFEYPIHVPDDKLKNGVRAPIVIDGVIFNGTEVLVMESKHQVTSKHASLFQKKCDILQENSMFVKNHPVKNYNIVPVMCSVAPLSSNLLKDPLLRNMKFLIRTGLKYSKL